MASVLGWKADRKVARSKLKVGDAEFVGGVRGANDGDVAVVLGYVAEQFEERVEPLVTGWCWGFAWRSIRDSVVISRHALALAIDANAPRHPLGKRGTFTTVQAGQCRKICAEVGDVVRWGGDYKVRADEMHFEINGTPEQVKVQADRIRAKKVERVRVPPTLRRLVAEEMEAVLAAGATRRGSAARRAADERVGYLQRQIIAQRSSRAQWVALLAELAALHATTPLRKALTRRGRARNLTRARHLFHKVVKPA